MVSPRPTAWWSFSSSELSPHARAGAVLRLRERGILPLEPLADQVPQADIVKLQILGAAILLGTLGGVRQIGQAKDPHDADEAVLGVNLRGTSVVRHSRQETVLKSWDGILFSSMEERFVGHRPTPVWFLGLRLPRKMLTQIVPNLDDAAVRVIGGQSNALRLLAAYLRSLDPAATSGSPELGQAVSTHIYDLIALTIGSAPDAIALARGRGARAARLQAIKADITRHAADCGLTIAAVAMRHGVTPRYIHKLFETEGVTFSEFVLSRRLAVAHRLLTDRRLAHSSITSIAFDAGFADLSYFNRVFRRRYSATPTEVRTSHSMSWPSISGESN